MNYCTICGNETNYITCFPCKRKDKEYGNREIPYDAEQLRSFSLRKREIAAWGDIEPRFLKPLIIDKIDTLTHKEEAVLRLLYGIDGVMIIDRERHIFDRASKRFRDVADEFKVSITRIRQIEAKALRKMRHPSRSKVFKDFFDLDNFWLSAPQMSQAELDGKLYQDLVDNWDRIAREERRREAKKEYALRQEKELEERLESEKRRELEMEDRRKERRLMMGRILRAERMKVVSNFKVLSLTREKRMRIWENRPAGYAMYQIGEGLVYSGGQISREIERKIRLYESELEFLETPCLMYPMHEKWDLFIKVYSTFVESNTWPKDSMFHCAENVLSSCEDFKNIIPSLTKFFFALCGAWNDSDALEMLKNL